MTAPLHSSLDDRARPCLQKQTKIIYDLTQSMSQAVLRQTLSTQILVSNIIPQLKKPGLFPEIADSRSGERNKQDKPQHLAAPGSNKVL